VASEARDAGWTTQRRMLRTSAPRPVCVVVLCGERHQLDSSSVLRLSQVDMASDQQTAIGLRVAPDGLAGVSDHWRVDAMD